MFKILVTSLSVIILAGCYEVGYKAPVEVHGTFTTSPDPQEKVVKLCMDITYTLKFGDSDTTGTEKKCIENNELTNGQLISKFNFVLYRSAKSYDVSNVNNIVLQTELKPDNKCQNCAITVYNRFYSAGLTELTKSGELILANLNFSFTNESSYEKWISAYEEIVRGCAVFGSDNVRKYCIELKTRPSLARTCHDNTDQNNSSEQRYCLYLGSSEP